MYEFMAVKIELLRYRIYSTLVGNLEVVWSDVVIVVC